MRIFILLLISSLFCVNSFAQRKTKSERKQAKADRKNAKKARKLSSKGVKESDLHHCGHDYFITPDEINNAFGIISDECSLPNPDSNKSTPFTTEQLCNCKNGKTKGFAFKGLFENYNKELEEEQANQFMDRYQALVHQKFNEISTLEVAFKVEGLDQGVREELKSACNPKALFKAVTASNSPCEKKDSKLNRGYLQNALKGVFGGKGAPWEDKMHEAYNYQFASQLLDMPASQGFLSKTSGYILRGESEPEKGSCLGANEAMLFQSFENQEAKQSAIAFLIKHHATISAKMNSGDKSISPRDLLSIINEEEIQRNMFSPFKGELNQFRQNYIKDPVFKTIVDSPQGFQSFMDSLKSTSKKYKMYMLSASMDKPVGINENKKLAAAKNFFKYKIGGHQIAFGLKTGLKEDEKATAEELKITEALVRDKIKDCNQMSQSLEKFSCAHPDPKLGESLKDEMIPILGKAVAEQKDPEKQKETMLGLMVSFCNNKDKDENESEDKSAYESILNLLEPASKSPTLAGGVRAMSKGGNHQNSAMCDTMKTLLSPDGSNSFILPDFDNKDPVAVKAREDIKSRFESLCQAQKMDDKEGSPLPPGMKTACTDISGTWRKINVMANIKHDAIRDSLGGDLSQEELNGVLSNYVSHFDTERSKKVLASSMMFSGGSNSILDSSFGKIMDDIKDVRKIDGRAYHVTGDGRIVADEVKARNIAATSKIQTALRSTSGGLAAGLPGITSGTGRSIATKNSSSNNSVPTSSGGDATSSAKLGQPMGYNQPADSNPTFNPGLASSANTYNGAFDNKVAEITDKVNSSPNISNKEEINSTVQNLKGQIAAAQQELENLKSQQKLANLQGEKDALQSQIDGIETSQNQKLNQLQDIADGVDLAESASKPTEVKVPENAYSTTDPARYTNNTNGGSTATTSGGAASAGRNRGSVNIDSSGNTITDIQHQNETSDMDASAIQSSRSLYDSGIRVSSTSNGSLSAQIPEDAVGADGSVNLSSDQYRSLIIQMQRSGQNSVVINVPKTGVDATYRLEDGQMKLVDYVKNGNGVQIENAPVAYHNLSQEFDQILKDSKIQIADPSITARAPASTTEPADDTAEVIQDAPVETRRDATLENLESNF